MLDAEASSAGWADHEDAVRDLDQLVASHGLEALFGGPVPFDLDWWTSRGFVVSR